MLQLLEKDIGEMDVKLQEGENYSNQWKPVTIDVAQEQDENMKVRVVFLAYTKYNVSVYVSKCRMARLIKLFSLFITL